MTTQRPLPNPPMTCFKAYDIRGRLGPELNEDIARSIGRAFAETLGATRVVVGRDCRASSLSLSAAVIDGLLAAGVEVLDLGLAGTEEMYFATTHLGACGGIEVTASHNPMDYNGMKMVGQGSAPLDPATVMPRIRALAESGAFAARRAGGRVVDASATRAAYVDRVLSFVDLDKLRPLKILVNAGNGAAGPTFDALAEALAARGAPLRFERMHHAPDGNFPNGIPNPLLPENQPATAEAVVAANADFGVAWDGDFDRCFLFDHNGQFVPGEYVVGLLAQVFLKKEPGAIIVHDPRVQWNTRAVVAAAGGRAQASRTGHAFLKQALRETGAVYGGEMSAHHYFRDFMACDSGMIPWLLAAELISRTGQSLANLLESARGAFPSSGEINFRVDDVPSAMARVIAAFAADRPTVDRLDGLSLAFADWRLNLRASNTEPLLRLNIETRGNAAALQTRLAEVSRLITS
ncbi:MAG TPA: phosphomannomutase [Paracoccaceae bacterium]|nr:phosphomannomutase [Paracoccaceae bacterium]